MIAGVHDALLAYWDVLSITVMVAACLIFVSSLDDVFLDLNYWLGGLFAGRQDYPTSAEIRQMPEKAAAIMIPAWRESTVIGAMLSRLCATLEYGDYHVFVGTYPNDPDTQTAVLEVASRFPQVHCVVGNNPGPTSKADCLNQVLQSALEYEKEEGVQFGFFVLQDSEDVIHAFSLKLINAFAGEYAMVQLPVLSLNRSYHNLVGGHYMDEFAELHSKDLMVRSRLTGSVPSAGVATSFSRAGIEMLRQGAGPVFNPTSLTEDYEVAHRLHQLGGEARFVRYRADMPYLKKRWFGERFKQKYRRELVFTSELFPHRFRASVRQKARWMLGISYLGWRRIGWYGDFWNRYFLMRDRKAMITAPTAMFGYLIVLGYLIAMGFLWFAPGLGPLPPLVRYEWVWVLILINFIFLVWRLLQRAWFVGRLHGSIHALLSPVRAVLGNFVAFFAFWRATRQYFGIQTRSRPVAWDKTDHLYPHAAVVKGGKPSVGDVLQHEGIITLDDVERAIDAMQETGRPLGLQLLDLGAVDDLSLARAYAECEGGAATTIDPLSIAARTGWLLKPREAARFCALPWMRLADDQVIVALGEPLRRRQRHALERRIRSRGVRNISYVFAPLSDISFGVRYFYGPDLALETARQKAAVLRQRGALNEAREAEVWRLVRRGYVRLGDALIRAGLIDQHVLERALRKAWRGKRHLSEVLRKSSQIAVQQLDEIVARRAAWQPDPLNEAIRAGYVSPWLIEGLDPAADRAAVEARQEGMRR